MIKFARIALVCLMIACLNGCASTRAGRTGPARCLRYEVVEVIDGPKLTGPLAFCDVACGTSSMECPEITGTFSHEAYMKEQATISPSTPGAIHMVLGFQLAAGKARADFEKFKELDRPWVAQNKGNNPATYFTKRTAAWPFDAYEDVWFATRADFDRAYAGTPALAKAGEGLFGPQVLVAIVK